MYLFVVICIYISVSAIGAFKMSVSFPGEIWLSGSFSVRDGVKTSLVSDTENETVLTPP